MGRIAGNWSVSVNLAPGVNEIKWIQQVTTLVALIASCIIILASWASTLNEAISQEAIMLLAIELSGGILSQISILVELVENILGNFGLLWGGCSSKIVETNIKPLVDVSVKDMVLVTELLWCAFLFQRLGLGSSTVLICSTDV